MLVTWAKKKTTNRKYMKLTKHELVETKQILAKLAKNSANKDIQAIARALSILLREY